MLRSDVQGFPCGSKKVFGSDMSVFYILANCLSVAMEFIDIGEVQKSARALKKDELASADTLRVRQKSDHPFLVHPSDVFELTKL